jgi:hypothetical protein
VREPQEGTPSLTQGTPMSTPPALLGELQRMGLKDARRSLRLFAGDVMPAFRK